MKRSELTGLGEGYRFTLRQQLKNRANLISAVILLVAALVSLPIASLVGGARTPFSGTELDDIWLRNDTDLPLTPPDGVRRNS